MANRIFVTLIVALITLGVSIASAALYSAASVVASFAAGAFKGRRR